MRTRSEHINWCKQRALEYVAINDLPNAFSSMASDLGKHDETEGHLGVQLGLMLMMNGHLSTKEKMREFINGFN